jgi:hypothetical protein
MEIYQAIFLILTGILAGFLNTVAGGGSLLTLPLMIFMGLDSVVANATNRVAIIFQNIFAVAGFKSKGVFIYPYGIYLGLASITGAVIGAKISVEIDSDLFNKILAIIMVAVVVWTILDRSGNSDETKERLDKRHQIYGVIMFFFIGIYGGFIQAGVGFLIIAGVTIVNRLSLVKTNSLKVLAALMYTSSALIVYIIEDKINWTWGLTLAVGNSAGGWIASRWSVKKGDKWIKRVLFVTVIVLAISLWFF